MSPASRVAMALLALALITTVPYYIVKNEGRAEYERVKAEVAEMEAGNAELRRDNAEIERRIVAFRNNPRLIERRARERLHLVRENDVILVFSEQRPRLLPETDATDKPDETEEDEPK